MPSKTVYNLNADTGANIIGNETSPLLRLANSGTGPDLYVGDLVVASGASISADQLTVKTPILAGNATITGISIRGASVASGAMFAFTGDALVSVTTIKFITGGVNGTKVIRIVQADGTFAWIPVLPDAAVTGAAI